MMICQPKANLAIHCPPKQKNSQRLTNLAERKEPGFKLLVGGCDTPLAAQVLLLALSNQPLVVYNADLVQAAILLAALPLAVPHCLAGVPAIPFLHCPQELAVGDGTMGPESLLPPGPWPEHGMPVGFIIVLPGLLGVALERDGHEDVAAGHADELRDDLVSLLRVNVLEH
eukprot:scaffold4574_cov38-Prasinocladus_malaysianus.AAC.1